MRIDALIVDSIEQAGIDVVLSVPCKMLAGVMDELDGRSLRHIPVCREEEGVGIAAGFALGGMKPLLLMQNSGLGNSVNALMSLTHLYQLPLFVLMSHRGGIGEKIAAQIPMGKSAPLLLKALRVDFLNVGTRDNLGELGTFMKKAFELNRIHAGFLSGDLWHATQ